MWLLLVLACGDKDRDSPQDSPVDTSPLCDRASTWYLDEDGDAYGAEGTAHRACEQPGNTTNQGGDCDDTDPDINPGAEDVPRNELDEDCSGEDTCSHTSVLDGDQTFTGRASGDMASFCSERQGLTGDLTVTATNVPNMYSLTCLCEVGGSLSLLENEQLTTPDGLDVLSIVGGDLVLRSNPLLEDTEGLHNLRTVGGSVVLEDNATLRDLSGLLTLESVGGDLVIRGNVALSEAAALALVAAVGQENVGGQVIVEGNGG